MKGYLLGGRSSPNNAGGGAGAAGPSADGRPGRHRRAARPRTERVASSNRSSPERSPESAVKRLRPLTSGSSAHSASGQQGVRRKRGASPHPATAINTTNVTYTGPSEVETPNTADRLAYFGSNESERDSWQDGSDGDASSSEDSATELLDRALGLSNVDSSSPPVVVSPPANDDVSIPVQQPSSSSSLSPARRELLIQRPVPEATHFGASWETALLRPKRPNPSAPRGRSLTPSASASQAVHSDSGSQYASLAGSIAARRRASPSQPEASHANPNLGHQGLNGHRSPTPTAASKQPTRWISFRFDLLPEVSILTASLVLAAVRMVRLPDVLGAQHEPIPISPLVMLIAIVPTAALFRKRGPEANYMFPFTDERGYRTPATVDDGFAAGAVIPILLAAGFLWDAVISGPERYHTLDHVRPLMDVWQAAGIIPAHDSVTTHTQLFNAVVKARISLLLTTSMNSFILVLHLILSRTILRIERLPTNNTKRLFGVSLLSLSVSFALWTLLALNDAFAWATPYVSPLEAAVGSFIYQMSLYLVTRLVRRGFTLGELSLATGAGISLALEFWRLTASRFFYAKYGGIPPTYRMPTPLLSYHHVMIPGAFLTGFCIAPLLFLSRHFAQMPSHRLKSPGSRGRNRKLVALGIFAALALIICLPFGGWAGWALGGRFSTAWLWGLRFLMFGGDGVEGMSSDVRGFWRLRRVGLALYWLGIVSAAVGGWQTRIVRARRIRLAKSKLSASTSNHQSASAAENGASISKATLEVVGVSNIRENRRMHVALDLRRKFFHALAVLMFVPAIAIDPAFTSLAFAAAFAIFTFAEYARYFAVYPIGAPIHVFFNEFVDSKDAGPVILSHFYLLTGCAGGLWLEGSGIKQYTGVLAVGIGDAFASVLGKRIGRLKWPNSSKTLFGTASFIVTIAASALSLRALGIVEHFSASHYLLATTLAGLLEAMSLQNDNLIIPIFFWSLLSLLEV